MDEMIYLSKAIDHPTQNVLARGGSFEAAIVKDSMIVVQGVNRVIGLNDHTTYSEVRTIRKACKMADIIVLSGSQICATCEPCPICFSAICWSHISKVGYVATYHDAEEVGFADAPINSEVCLNPTQHSIPFLRINHPERDIPFITWLNKEDKEQY